MTIQMPYGGVINWTLGNNKSVHQPKANHGYRHLVAYKVHSGSHAHYIADECQKAKDAGAPKDAIYLSGSPHTGEERVWETMETLRENNPDCAARVDTYVKVMEQLEKESRGR